MNIGLLLISTNRYKQFVQPLLNGVVKNFLPNHQITVHLFTDEYQDLVGDPRVRIEQHLIPAYKFPYATLYRYKIFAEHADILAKYDFLVYSDVDMEFALPVGDEFLAGDITGVRHPGFWYNNGWGSGGNPTESLSYLEPQYHKKYFCGGVNGGKADKFLNVAKLLSTMITDDESRGVMPVYHDETMFNWFMNYGIHLMYPDWVINELTPEYCSVPSMEQRKNWGIDHLPARIIALDKSHAELRA